MQGLRLYRVTHNAIVVVYNGGQRKSKNETKAKINKQKVKEYTHNYMHLVKKILTTYIS